MLLLGTTDALYDGDPAERRGRRGRYRAGARRGGGRGRSGAARPRPCAGDLCRAARPPRRGGGDDERPPRDRLHAGQGRDAERRRRQADDLPPDRPRRARASSAPSSGCTGSTAAPGRFRGRQGSTGCSSRSRSSRRSARTCASSTARSPPRCSPRRSSDPSCSSRSSPGAPEIAAAGASTRPRSEWAQTRRGRPPPSHDARPARLLRPRAQPPGRGADGPAGFGFAARAAQPALAEAAGAGGLTGVGG